MIGITAVGGYVPRYRLSGKLLAQVWGVRAARRSAPSPGTTRTSLTMACEAALNALDGRDPKKIGAGLLASTTPPYLEKSSATILAAVADLGDAVLTVDLGGSLRCGTILSAPSRHRHVTRVAVTSLWNV